MAEQLRQDVVNGIGVALASVGCVLESAFELGVGEIVEIPRPDRVHSFEHLDDFRSGVPSGNNVAGSDTKSVILDSHIMRHVTMCAARSIALRRSG